MRNLFNWFVYFVFFASSSFQISCNTITADSQIKFKNDRWSDWLIKNEDLMNIELNNRAIQPIIGLPKGAEWTSRSIVVTKYDSGILGHFAKIVNEYSSCLIISYTLYPDSSIHKILTLSRDYSQECIVNDDSIFTHIDTLKHFLVRKEIEPVLYSPIRIGADTIDPKALRFKIISDSSLYTLVIAINSEKSGFKLNKPLKDSLPLILFGNRIKEKRINRIIVREKTLADSTYKTIGQIQSFFY